ncbi:MAG: CaiB/BaiF CoA-transferase family protein [Acetobacteraceae bacterium]
MQAPLAGLRVIEFTHMVMGPAVGLALADLGADVIKVEPAAEPGRPGGDNTRRLRDAGAGFFAMLNRNKRSLALDLKSAEGLATAKQLLATADVLIENFRPGALDKLGLSYAALAEANPRLIYCSCKGFLPGPYETRVALDEVVQMMGGLAYMTGLPGRPMRAGSSINDILGGIVAALGVMAAVEERHRTGRGKHVQSGLFETNAMLVAQHMAQAVITGQAPPPMGVRRPAWPIYDIFDCADGLQVFVGVVTDTQWRLFCEQFGLDALAADPALGTQEQRRAARDRVIPIAAATLAGLSSAELMARCEAMGLPFAPIATPSDLFEDRHLNAAGGLVTVTLPEDGRQVKLPAFPLALDGERLGLRRDLPAVGQHNAEILAELRQTTDAPGKRRASAP